jgi:hypothetical protein
MIVVGTPPDGGHGMQRLVAGGMARAAVMAGAAWVLWSRDPARAVAGIAVVLIADRWRTHPVAVVAGRSLMVNAGAVAMSGGVVTVLGNAGGIQHVDDGSGR